MNDQRDATRRAKRPPISRARMKAARARAARQGATAPRTMTPLDGWVLERLEPRLV